MFTEREIFPYATLDDLRLDLVPRVKQMAASRFPEHPWKEMSDMELFRSAGLYEDDKRTGKTGFNLAGILLFGKDEVIRSCAPGYLTDCLLRRENTDRYDDRVTVGTNLIEAYDAIMEFIAKHTLDKFFLIGDQNVSVRTWIAREMVSNILVHREYSNAFMAKVVIEQERIVTENWNRSNYFGRIDPQTFTARSKNPILARFFVNMGRADELGSGVRNLYKYTKIYSGGEPELIEGDVFRTIIPLGEESRTSNVPRNDLRNVPRNDLEKIILEMITQNENVTAAEIATAGSGSLKTVQRHLKALKDAGVIRRSGSTKSGRWEVVQK
jgi:ATP-dependent DNA helicase RecG